METVASAVQQGGQAGLEGGLPGRSSAVPLPQEPLGLSSGRDCWYKHVPVFLCKLIYLRFLLPKAILSFYHLAMKLSYTILSIMDLFLFSVNTTYGL